MRRRKSVENLLQQAVDFSSAKCEKCMRKMRYMGAGRFVCERCGGEYYTDFGKVKKYLADNGPKSAVEIVEATGVAHSDITKWVKEGRITIIDAT